MNKISERRVKVGGKHSSPRIGPLGLGQEALGSLPNAQTCFLGSLISREYKDCRAKVLAKLKSTNYMGSYTVSGSRADCKSVAFRSGGSTPSLPTKISLARVQDHGVLPDRITGCSYAKRRCNNSDQTCLNDIMKLCR